MLFGGLSRCVFGFFSLFCSFHQHFVPLGLTRLTLDDCLVVLVTDGLMPQGARVTKNGGEDHKLDMALWAWPAWGQRRREVPAAGRLPAAGRGLLGRASRWSTA